MYRYLSVEPVSILFYIYIEEQVNVQTVNITSQTNTATDQPSQLFQHYVYISTF